MAVLRPGAHVTLTIDRLSLGGDGVARHDGRVVFVPNVAPGDQVEVQVTDLRDRFAKALPVRMIKPAADRVAPPCKVHPVIPLSLQARVRRSCGGCGWQHLAYEAQLKAKSELVRETLERLGGIKNIEVKPTLGMKDPWRYRNKVQQPVGWDSLRGRLVSGFYATGSHEIVAIDDCLVQPELSVRLVNRAKALLDDEHVRAYDSRTNKGWIRHLLVRTTLDGKALLTFVTSAPNFPRENKIITILGREFPELLGIHQNVNPNQTNVILGRDWRRLAGQDYLEEKLGPLTFRLSPASFFQVNSIQAEVLYDVVKRVAGRGKRLLDLYTGVGTIALWLANNFEEVGGIEEIHAAINDARDNAERNHIENARFEAAPVEAFLRGLPRNLDGSDFTVILDPPRAGCEPDVLKSLASLRPSSLVYVSCDPGTLARDLGVLTRDGYRITEVQPVDMFPHTPHIETVVKLTAEDKKDG